MSAHAPEMVQSESDGGWGAVYGGPISADAFLSLGSMEGLYGPIVAPSVAPSEAAAARALYVPGFALAGGVATLAYLVHYLPVAPFSVAAAEGIRNPVSAAMIAIVLGLLIRNTIVLPAAVNAGCKQAVKKAIPIAIVCTGAGLNMTALAGVGFTALAITFGCVVFSLASGYYIARALGLRSKTAMLLGAGTGICGNSAIVAVAPLIDAEDDDVALAVGTVNLFGLAAMLAWPVIGGWLALSDARFGVWAGASIHAVPQVVAAGFAYSSDAGTLATLVKLVRVALLAPMVFVLALLYARHRRSGAPGEGGMTIHYARLVPWFVWGFIALALMNTLGLLPTLHFPLTGAFSDSTQQASVSVGPLLTNVGKVLLTIAMAAIGLEVNLRHLARVGGRAITAGLITTLAVGAVSLALVSAFL